MGNKGFQTKRLIIKPINSEDILGLYELYSNPKVCEFFDINPYHNIQQAQKQITQWIKLSSGRKQFRYSIFFNDIFIGTCGIYSIYWHQKRASLGYDLDPKYWNKGFMNEALKEFFKFIHEEFKIHRLQATVLPNNKQSIKLLSKLGFQKEGLLNDYEIWKEEFVNLEIHSIILK